MEHQPPAVDLDFPRMVGPVAVHDVHRSRLEEAVRELPPLAWLGEVEVGAAWLRYALPLGLLPPGETTLTLACRGPAIAANDVLHNDDPRALGLAVGSWRVEKSELVR